MFLVYTRVSTAEQASDKASSMYEQERKGHLVAKLHNADHYDITVYKDPGVSGTVPLCERPGGAKMLLDAVSGDTIVASKMDRLFRSAVDALQTVAALKRKNVHLILADISTDPIDGKGTGKLFFGMLAVFAEFERERINERTKEGIRAKAAKGGHLGGSPPFGYRVDGAGRAARLVPVESEQLALNEIKRIWHEHTPASACRTINAAGFRDRAGSEFRIGQLKRIAERELSI